MVKFKHKAIGKWALNKPLDMLHLLYRLWVSTTLPASNATYVSKTDTLPLAFNLWAIGMCGTSTSCNSENGGLAITAVSNTLTTYSLSGDNNSGYLEIPVPINIPTSYRLLFIGV